MISAFKLCPKLERPELRPLDHGDGATVCRNSHSPAVRCENAVGSMDSDRVPGPQAASGAIELLQASGFKIKV
eukprot:1650508-Rhodomonas_salina.2